jgi:hypothetical protein
LRFLKTVHQVTIRYSHKPSTGIELERNLILGVLGVTLLALAVALLVPGGRSPDPNPRLPWLIEVDPAGNPTVFGLTLGRSTLADARQAFESEGKANIFVSTSGRVSLEAYFNRLYLSGIKADMVLSLSLAQEKLDGIYRGGLRISQLGDGSKKVSISPQDMHTVAGAVIERITYLPAARLDQELVQQRFGKPGSIIREKSGIEHWLYPERGLDIALNPEGKEVFQYVRPDAFDEVIKPLQ